MSRRIDEETIFYTQCDLFTLSLKHTMHTIKEPSIWLNIDNLFNTWAVA